jgi:hypothetical protein
MQLRTFGVGGLGTFAKCPPLVNMNIALAASRMAVSLFPSQYPDFDALGVAAVASARHKRWRRRFSEERQRIQ